VLAHDRRRILHFGVTAHPTAEWTAQQLREASPWDSAPRFLLRDRDRIFGADFTRQVKEFGIQEVLGAPRAPRQRAYIERVIGTIRRECLDLSFAKNTSAGIALRCRAFVTVMQAAEVRNLDDRPDTRDLPNMRTLFVES
jgi:transposase InsO family protein